VTGAPAAEPAAQMPVTVVAAAARNTIALDRLKRIILLSLLLEPTRGRP
jgi:hypothetical protein